MCVHVCVLRSDILFGDCRTPLSMQFIKQNIRIYEIHTKILSKSMGNLIEHLAKQLRIHPKSVGLFVSSIGLPLFSIGFPFVFELGIPSCFYWIPCGVPEGGHT